MGSDSWVMVDGAGQDKRTDFEALTLTKGIGTPLWMAPEVLAGLPYNELVDVYSFGRTRRGKRGGHAWK